MKQLATILAIFVLIYSCKTKDKTNTLSISKFDTLKAPTRDTGLYFNQKENPQENIQGAIDSFSNRWYSKMLFAMKEPILISYKGNKEVYRFTWLRTFHHPVSIRFEKQDDIFRLTTKVCNGAGGYEPGILIKDTIFDVSEKEYKNLISRLDSINFWVLKTEDPNNTGKDGSEWILEGIKGNNYYMVTRWTPSSERQGNFRIVGEYLLSISKLPKQEIEFSY